MENEHDQPKQQTEEAPQASSEASEVKTKGSSRGKLLLGLLVAVVLIVSTYLVLRRTLPSFVTVSRTGTAAITLVTSDRTDVACVSLQGIQGYHCGFTNEITNWQGDEQNMLKPFYTLDRHLYLIPGLFLEPAIRSRYQSEIPNKPRELLKRFTAHCQIKIIGKLAGVRTHWIANSPWSNPEDIEVGTISACKIEG